MSRRHPAPRSSPPRSSLSPNNPFASLDPALHPSSLSGPSDHRDLSPGLSGNRLTDFAQHVLEDGSLAMHGHGVRHDAENLLAFSAEADEFLRHATQFGDLLDVDGRGHMGENGMRDHSGGDYGNLRGGDEREVDGQLGDEGLGESQGGGRMNMRKRKARSSQQDDGDPGRTRKDNHKEVERRRRETINDGMSEIAALVPGGDGKLGKSMLLRRTAIYLKDLIQQVESIDEDRAKWEHEKADLERDLSSAQGMLQEEHSRSLRFETTWREAEDRAASAQFELERVKGELEALRNAQ